MKQQAQFTPNCASLLAHPRIVIGTDDMYEKIWWADEPFSTLAEVVPALYERTVTINGVSKSHAMTGWRIGFAGAPISLIKAMDKLQSQSTSNTSSVSQAAAVEALTGQQDSIEDMRKVYERRRNMVVDMLNAAPGLRCHKPEGAFYVFPDMRGCMGKTTAGGKKIETDEDFTIALLEETGVATVHGAAFLSPGHFRISYATSDAALSEACTRIQKFCAGMK